MTASLAGPRVWLFDLDGTLVDSAPVHAAAFRTAIAELAPDRLAAFRYAAHAGSTSRQVVATLGLDPVTAVALVGRKQQLYREYVAAGRVPLLPGARGLLDTLAGRGCPLFLVTSGSRGSIEPVLDACRLDRYFRGVLTGDDLAAGKPDPAVYREACRRFGVAPAEVVVVEDSAHGVAAALGAGLLTVHVHAAVPALGCLPAPRLDQVLDLFPVGVRG